MADPTRADTMVKISPLPQILGAAGVLHELGLLNGKPPNEFVKEYIEANPDINELMQRPETFGEKHEG